MELAARHSSPLQCNQAETLHNCGHGPCDERSGSARLQFSEAPDSSRRFRRLETSGFSMSQSGTKSTSGGHGLILTKHCTFYAFLLVVPFATSAAVAHEKVELKRD